MELPDVILDILQREKITTILVSHDADEVVMVTNVPAATIGEVLSIGFPKPRDRASVMQEPHLFHYLLTFTGKKVETSSHPNHAVA